VTNTNSERPRALNRGLVLVRAGRNHCFDSALQVERTDRSWDIAFSIYDDTELTEQCSVDILHRYKGGKWCGIYSFFAEFPQLLNSYDYFWLVDDDIEVDWTQISALFDYVRHYKFELAQPALTEQSYFSHRLTLRCPGFLHRHTNLVEIMAPILSARLLRKILPYFVNTHSGFGIDWYWQSLVSDPWRAIAIIDAIAVKHGRPPRQHLRREMERYGVTPEMERDQLVRELGLRRLHAIATRGVTEQGTTIPTRIGMCIAMLPAYWSIRGKITTRRWGVSDSFIVLFRHLFSHLGFSRRLFRISRKCMIF